MSKVLTTATLQSAIDAAVTSAVATALSSVTPNDGLWRPRDLGYFAASSDPSVVLSTQTSMVSQTQYVTAMKMDQAVPITKISWYRTTAGATVTEATIGIYDSTGAKLCEADVTAELAAAAAVDVVTFPTPSRGSTGDCLRAPARHLLGHPAGAAWTLRRRHPQRERAGDRSTTSRYGTLGTGVAAAPATITPSAIVPS